MMYFPEIPIPEYYTKENYATLIDMFYSINGWQGESLGMLESGQQIYGFYRGDPKKPCIFMISTIHGDEWQASYWTKLFMEMLTKTEPNTHSKIFGLLDKSFCYYIIPVANPDGYINNTSTNANGVNLNRDYTNQTQLETQIITAKILDKKPVTVIDSHTQHSDNYSLATGNRYFDAAIAEAIRSSSNILSSAVTMYPHTTNENIARIWSSKQTCSTGRKTWGTLIEAPYSSEAENRQIRFGIVAQTLICLYSLGYHRFSIQNPTLQQLLN